MNCVLAFVIGILCAIVGCLAAGFIAESCTRWYHISSFEGGAGYYVVFIALGGLVAGFGIGAVSSLSVLLRGGGFGKGLGLSMAILASLSVLSFGLAWIFGDVPPKLRGDELFVRVELQCPSDWQPTNKVRSDQNYVVLRSLGAGNRSRHATSTQLPWKTIRHADGRVVFGADLFLFTSTGRRLLEFSLGEVNVANAIAPLPGHPGAALEQWSEWLLAADPSGADSGFLYRFRVQRESDYDIEEQERLAKLRQTRRDAFAGLNDSSPLALWLPFTKTGGEGWDETDAAMNQKAIEAIRERPEELVALLNSPDLATAKLAIKALDLLVSFPPSVEPALREAARRSAVGITQYNATYDEIDPDTVTAMELKIYFMDWAHVWQRLVRSRKDTIPPELHEIREAARQGHSGTEIESIASLAESYQSDWEALAVQQ